MKKAKKKTAPRPKRTIGGFKILKETPKKFVCMDVEMDGELMDFLLKYADENIDKQAEREYRLSWAFADIIEKQLEFQRLSKAIEDAVADVPISSRCCR